LVKLSFVKNQEFGTGLLNKLIPLTSFTKFI
jgi:hypothetical protein